MYKIDQIGRQGNNVFSNIAKISKEGEIDPHHPVFGLKRDLIRFIGNMGYRHKSNQDLVSIVSKGVAPMMHAGFVRMDKNQYVLKGDGLT